MPFHGTRVGWALHVGCYPCQKKKASSRPACSFFPLFFYFTTRGSVKTSHITWQRCQQSPLEQAASSRGSSLLESHHRAFYSVENQSLFFSADIFSAHCLRANSDNKGEENKERRRSHALGNDEDDKGNVRFLIPSFWSPRRDSPGRV